MGSGISIVDIENLSLPQLYVLIETVAEKEEEGEKKAKKYWSNEIHEVMESWRKEELKKQQDGN